jgi:hypothetical protein
MEEAMTLVGLFRTLAIVGMLSGCATTEITTSWKDPKAKPLEQNTKVAAVVVMSSPGQRRAAEEQLAKKLKNGTPAYRLFTDQEIGERQLVRERLKQQGFKYVVVMKVRGVLLESSDMNAPSVQRVNMWDDGSLMWGDTGATTAKVFVDTGVYSVDDGNLIWEAQSKTFNPDRAEKLVDEIAKAATERLQKDGLLTASK